MKKPSNFIITFLILLFMPLVCFGVSLSHTFSQYSNRVFVETGSYYGQGINHALTAGFREIRSIELAPKYFKYCTSLFQNYPNVSIYFGDSSKILYEVIKDINEPITFWLDGHYSGEDTALGESQTPILAELDQIKQHPIKTHTILIDDVRQFGTIYFDYISKDEIILKLLEINPFYEISYVDGFIKDDILVAVPPKN